MDRKWRQHLVAVLHLVQQVDAGLFPFLEPNSYALAATPNAHITTHYSYAIALAGPLRGFAVFVFESLIGGGCACCMIRAHLLAEQCISSCCEGVRPSPSPPSPA